MLEDLRAARNMNIDLDKQSDSKFQVCPKTNLGLAVYTQSDDEANFNFARLRFFCGGICLSSNMPGYKTGGVVFRRGRIFLMSSTRRALAIHHDSVTREQLRKCLVSSGWEVFAAEGRTSGLRLLYDVRPDLILLELMAGGEGWEIFSLIRLFTDCPLILLAEEIPIHTYCPASKYNALVLLGQVPANDVSAIALLLCGQLPHMPREQRLGEKSPPPMKNRVADSSLWSNSRTSKRYERS